MKKCFCSFLAIIYVFLSIFSHCAPALAASEQIVRVGYYEIEGFQYKDEYGNLAGYNIEYLKLVANITGWTYEFVEVKDFAEGARLLENKEIDLFAPCMESSNWSKKFIYSEYSFGTEYSLLVTNSDNDSLYYEDYDNFEGMDVSTVQGYPILDYYIEYMQEQGFESNLVHYANPNAAATALSSNVTDASVIAQFDLNENHKVLARFAQVPFYYISWKGNYIMMRDLNEAMRKIQNTYPGFTDKLYEEYFPDYDVQYYTREEVEYIEAAKPLKVAYVQEWMPLSFTNESGEFDGISRKIFDEIENVSGLKFQYEPLPEGDIYYEYLVQNGFDLVMGVSYSSINMNMKGIRLTEPYMSSKKVFVGKDSTEYGLDTDYVVGIVNGSQTVVKEIKAEYPRYEVVEFDTIEECFDAVNDGEVDFLLQNQYVVDNWISRSKYENLKVIPVAGMADSMCFSTVVEMYDYETMSTGESDLVISIIDKALTNISDDLIEDIIVQETMEHQYEYDFSDFVYSYRHTLVITAIAFFAILVFVVYATWLKRTERHKMHLQQIRYKHILDNSNDMIYEINMQAEASVFSDKLQKKFGWEFPKNFKDISLEKIPEALHIWHEDARVVQEAMGKIVFNSENVELLVRMECASGDYIWCNITGSPLIDNNKIVSIVGKIEDVNDEVREKLRLEHKSRTDGLTGLMNKQTFAYETEKFLNNNSACHSGIIFLDMDNFKNVNDSLGHPVGDRVIVDTAKKLQIIFANFDFVARFGGDEFCVFVKEIPKETLVDKLLWANDKMRATYSEEGVSVDISASIGAAYCTTDAVEYKTFLREADKALYDAKKRGRNCFVIREI